MFKLSLTQIVVLNWVFCCLSFVFVKQEQWIFGSAKVEYTKERRVAKISLCLFGLGRNWI